MVAAGGAGYRRIYAIQFRAHNSALRAVVLRQVESELQWDCGPLIGPGDLYAFTDDGHGPT
jgi:hypothetical protein